MDVIRSMPPAGFIVIVVILCLFVLAVVLLAHLYIRYKYLAAKASGEPARPGSFGGAVLAEYAAAYKKYGQDVNTPAIITEAIGSHLGGLLLCERFLNNAVSLFVTLGLFGTFLGLSLSVASLTELISLSNSSEWLSILDSVGGGLMSALSGMGVAFYTSLVGAGCSIILTILRTVLNPQTQRERLETRLELWLDTEIAPNLATDAARDEAGLVKLMVRSLENAVTDVREALFKAADSYGDATRASSAAISAASAEGRQILDTFNGTIGRFNDGIHDFAEVDYNLRGSVERMDLAVRDLANAFREISRRMEGAKH
ncbi:MAG: MotA/TolQ/ExbB proton channel family protein [Oscillospiraceae bacterium]|nr:MotA/TolQ/ExbB proton channel family protein [Oscillospiraceae bacterium]